MSQFLSVLKSRVGSFLFFLLILVIMLDPTSTILHLKDKVFVVLVGYNILFFRPSFRFVPQLVAVMAMVATSYLIACLQGNIVNLEGLTDIAKAFSPLILLLWVHHYDLITLCRIPALLTCVVIWVIYICCSISEPLEGLIYAFMGEHNETVMMSHRYIMGFRIFGLYYKSFVCLVFVLFHFYYNMYNVPKHRVLNILAVIVMTFAFFVSGTRTTMLLPLFMMSFVSYRTIASKRYLKYLLYPCLGIFVLLFLGVVVILASETGELSNQIKYAHLSSYAELFNEHPQYFLLGEGPATKFYSSGFHRYTDTTEWTYIELVRSYGISCLCFWAVIFYPIVKLWKYKQQNYVFGIIGSYAVFILMSGTNPLLISSTGMLVILCAYSFLCTCDKRDNHVEEAVEDPSFTGVEHDEIAQRS